jgi:hypothetical protein
MPCNTAQFVHFSMKGRQFWKNFILPRAVF